METKPIVTCHGDQSLFSSLHPTLLQGLPSEATEWRRSYSRAPKTVYLEASFVPYDEDILPTETDKTLVSRPYFHIFWTSCDLDTYKQTIREELVEWTSALKRKNIPDWLIVVVVTDESKLKSKLLPRSSVYDKIRSDFCNKQPERCVAVTEPLKQDQRMNESWQVLLQRLRSLLLQAFNRHLNKYEDGMRSLREKRNEPGWKFNNFFLVQEELAFMYEMLGLFEDALIQYDELDALFTQYILFYAAGNPVNWMLKYTAECTKWSGLSLRKPINRDIRDLIKDNKDNLLDFRSYLFSRQCALLFLLDKPLDIPKRAMEFLHNTVQEIHKLKVTMPVGSIDCWVFLSCLEILNKCENFMGSDPIKSYSLYTASLWDYARKKLRCLGELCGLRPEPDIEPTSDQLTLVLDLISGLATKDDDDKEDIKKRPPEKLREALSSKDAFTKTYLELSELAMGTFKHISRFRSARLIGKDLADFYILQGEPEKAENFLMDAMKSFHQEGWHHLADDMKLELAKCQKLLGNRLKYLKTACQVVSSPTLSTDVRQTFQTEIFSIAKECSGSNYVLKAAPMFVVEDVVVQEHSIICDQTVTIDLHLQCDIPEAVHCDSVSLSVRPHAVIKHNVSGKRLLCKIDSGGMLKEQVPNFNPIRKPVPSQIEVKANMDSGSCGIVCVNSQDLLRRMDSSKNYRRESQQTKEDFSEALVLQEVELKPGKNVLSLSKQVKNAGGHKPHQLLIKIGGLDFLKTLETEEYFCVSNIQPVCVLKPAVGDYLLSGITQQASLSISPGSFHLTPGETLKLETSQSLTVTTESDDNTLVVMETENGKPQEFKVQIHHQRENSMTSEAQMIVMCNSFPLPVKMNLTLNSPFWVTHKILTAGDRKYIQISLDGSTKEKFLLTDPVIHCENPDIELLPMNKQGQELSVSRHQTVSYVWQLKCNSPKVNSVKLLYTVHYSSPLDISEKTHKLTYAFTIADFQTLYTVKMDVKPEEGKKMCTVGSLAVVTIRITRSQWCSDTSPVLYKIEDKPDVWAVTGKSSGLIDIPDGQSEITLNVIPLKPGLLHFPILTLFRPNKGAWTTSGNNRKSESPTDISPDEESNPYQGFSRGQVYYASSSKQVQVFTDSTKGGKSS
ncbi:trafficking protein particle complex subunit 10-like [Saccostrea echinata]|uniref:trafficking protein particle complex subunit 10-like n=1 Tax=Saccostrea echinata TaxID=191078 RepID=UPI002A83319C|nr:trafficking protein particle complex subunit 10-like [Saccostrea echinata]